MLAIIFRGPIWHMMIISEICLRSALTPEEAKHYTAIYKNLVALWLSLILRLLPTDYHFTHGSMLLKLLLKNRHSFPEDLKRHEKAVAFMNSFDHSDGVLLCPAKQIIRNLRWNFQRIFIAKDQSWMSVHSEVRWTLAWAFLP